MPKKSTKKKTVKKPAARTAKSPKTSKASKVEGHHNCTVCNKPGHNARSHAPGGRLA